MPERFGILWDAMRVERDARNAAAESCGVHALAMYSPAGFGWRFPFGDGPALDEDTPSADRGPLRRAGDGLLIALSSQRMDTFSCSATRASAYRGGTAAIDAGRCGDGPRAACPRRARAVGALNAFFANGRLAGTRGS